MTFCELEFAHMTRSHRADSQLGAARRCLSPWFWLILFVSLEAGLRTNVAHAAGHRGGALVSQPKSQALEAATHVCASHNGKIQALREIWKRKFRHAHGASLRQGANYTRNLFDVQWSTAPLLEMAAVCRDLWMLNELSEVYFLAFTHLEKSGAPDEVWVEQSASLEKGREVMLHSAQFSFALARLSEAIMGIPGEVRTPAMRALLDRSLTFLARTLTRWTQDKQTMWIWPECGTLPGRTVDRAYSLSEYVSLKREKRLARLKGAPAYCNALLEIELWVGASTAIFLELSEREPRFPQREGLATFTKDVTALFEQRLEIRTGKRSNCDAPCPVLAIDPGGRAGHPEYSAPDWKDKPTAWDLPHASRFIYYIDTTYRLRQFTLPSRDGKLIRTALANTLAHLVFNGNMANPRFSNYLDGSNGAYRKCKSWDHSFAYLLGGFASLADTQPVLRELNRRILMKYDGQSYRWPVPRPPRECSDDDAEAHYLGFLASVAQIP